MKKPLFTVLALFCIGSATAYIRSTIENQTFHPNGNIKSEVVEINGVKLNIMMNQEYLSRKAN